MATYKGLTLEEIIECFTDPSNNQDSQLLNIFLYTYRNYCTSMDIIKLINTRLKSLNGKIRTNEYNPDENIGFTKAVITLLNSWLTFPFAYDFCEMPDFKSVNYLLNKIRSWPKFIIFIKSSESFTESFRRLEDKIENVLNVFSTQSESNTNDFREMAVDCEFRDSFMIASQYRDQQYNSSLLYQPADIIARSLTYIDQKVLENLKLQELLTYTRKQAAPSVKSIIDKYNDLYNVVILTVKDPALARKRYDQYQYSGRNSPVQMDDPIPIENITTNKKTDRRFQVIEKWVQIAQVLSNLRNYSSLMAIITALDSPENISVMRKSSKLYNQYQSLVKINEPHINQHEEQMKGHSNGSSQNPPMSSKSKGKHKNIKVQMSEIPYLGIYLKNLAIIDDGFPDFLNASDQVYNGNEERLINLYKCRRQFDVLVQVKMCISENKNNEVVPDEQFLKWYSEIQNESKREKTSMSNSSSSLESVQSTNSNESNISSHSLNLKPRDLKNNKSVERPRKSILNSEVYRKRSQSIPINSTNPFMDSKICKVATVKLIQPKHSERTFSHLYQSTSHLSHKYATTQKKPETISNAQLGYRDRPSILNVVRSTSALNKIELESRNLHNILYKKIQINEKDHTLNFIERVFDKFGIPDVDPSLFEVVQRLDNGREITIIDNANLFYALAEQKHYQIEVQPKRKQMFS